MGKSPIRPAAGERRVASRSMLGVKCGFGVSGQTQGDAVTVVVAAVGLDPSDSQQRYSYEKQPGRHRRGG